MNKHQRALRAARAAKRIPIVGTAVTAAPIARALADTAFNSSNITSFDTWSQFFRHLTTKFTGYDTATKTFSGAELVATWLPIGLYAASKKFGLAKYPSKVLSKVGLRF